jgi:glycosyltransferase involved in cell wall biosynthesis
MRIGYVLKMFPRLSETFILNELLELERQGVEIEVFSLHRPGDPHFHSRLGGLRGEISYSPDPDSSDLWRFIRSGRPHLATREEQLGATLLRSLQRRNVPPSQKLFLQSLWLACVIQQRGIDHLHAHFATSSTEVAMLARAIAGVSFSFTAHAKDIYHCDTDRELLTEALESSAFAVTVTDFNLCTLQVLSPSSAHKVKRIYNGLPLEILIPVPEPDAKTPLILSVGRLIEKKGFRFLIEACAILRARGHEFRCRIIGAGEQQAELQQLIDASGLTAHVQLAGAQTQDVVLDAIRASSMVVLPCVIGEDGNRDALPTVLLESLALCRPVVSTDLPGVTEIIDDGVNGYMAQQRDSAGLADAMERLLLDRRIRARMGSNARRKAEALFDVRRSVAELKKHFELAVCAGAHHDVACIGGVR